MRTDRFNNDMLKVLHFYKTYYPDSYGGIEQVIFQLVETGLKKDISASVLSVSPHAGESTIGHHKAYKAKQDISFASSPFSVSAIKQFAELSRQADVIHFHFPWPYMDMVDLLARVKKPKVVSYHSDIIRQKRLLPFYKPLMHHFLKRVDRIIATSPNYVETSEVLRRYKDKVSVIPIGLDEQTYPVPDEPKIAHWRSKIAQPYFLFIGTLRYYKGLHILLDALKDAPYRAVIVGAGPIEQELKQQAERLALTNVQFLGALPDVDKVALLQDCYGIVFPSHLRSEAFGISLLEGAMCGKPLISSEIGTGTTYINIDQQTGLVVPPSDPLALRRAMDRLWFEPQFAAACGVNARRRFETLFTSDVMVDKYKEIYQQLV